jgi:3-methyladenine DNA glycosylase AlkD
LTSELTLRAKALVAERLPTARGLGMALGELVDQPEEFVAVARDGLERLADEPYRAEQGRVAPGSGAVFGVRNPLLAAVARQLRAALRQGSDASATWLAERLASEPEREFTLLAHTCLLRALPDDPERTWQLMRRLAHTANEWISVDSLAELYARGILLESFRWAELEQLVYAQRKWERRLVGSTVARLPFELPRRERPSLAASPALTLIGSLIGDAEADVQKALSWALRSWLEVDPDGVRRMIAAEADAAREANDGHRAWVLRDALTSPLVDHVFAAGVRARLDGLRRSGHAASTSSAAEIVRGFSGVDLLAEAAVSQQGVRQGRAPVLSGVAGSAGDD